MATHIARYAKPEAAPATANGHLTLLTDQSRDAVFLRGRVRCGPAFAGAMLALGRVVQLAAAGTAKDHSAYQAWVEGQYLREIGATRARRAARLPALRKEAAALASEIDALSSKIRRAFHALERREDIQRFYDWLWTHNRKAWYRIDPIVSVQHDATFFEGFSRDESVYAHVRLPHEALADTAPILPGTTNIDFSVGLEREFARIRSYRPLELTVGAEAVRVQSAAGAVEERKIDLPDSWVRGLVEVQSALMLAPVTLRLAPSFVAEIVARLEAERETHGPRSLRFRLTPGEPVAVEIEPFGTVLVDRGSRYAGERAQEIRVWGRRRLRVLRDLLPDATALEVRLLGSGMPSFWTLHVNEVELTVGLSGWTALDWAGRARFGALVPASSVPDQLLTRAAALLKSAGRMGAPALAAAADAELPAARGALQKLCLLGKAMYDPMTGDFRWRELYPAFDPGRLDTPAREERAGIALHAASAVRVEEESVAEGILTRTATVEDTSPRHVLLETDMDNRVRYAECSCGYFRANKLRQGPCRHLVALSLVGVRAP